MPYKSPDEVAEKVRGTEKLSEKKRRQFQHVFNSCFEKHSDDALCHKMAWGAVKKGKKSCEEVAESIDWDQMVERMEARRMDVVMELREAGRDLLGAIRCLKSRSI